MINDLGKIDKAWGYEEIFASTDKYCGKFMYFVDGGTFSMHFHKDKQESWYVDSGEFELYYIDTTNARKFTLLLGPGDIWTNKVLVPHQLHCLKAGRIIEVSQPDHMEDNYRIIAGDSQNGSRLKSQRSESGS